MNGKVTHCTFSERRICETQPLYQYDYGQMLIFDDIELPESYEVIFSNGAMKDGKIQIGS